MSSSIEPVLNTLGKERCELALLTLMPFNGDQTVFRASEEIDEAMFNRMQGKKHFKVGQAERLVYEKIAGLKKVNILQSALYNFCSEGVFSQLEIPVGLIGARPDDVAVENLADVSQNVRAQILLEKIRWVLDSIDHQGCAKCAPTKQ